MQRVAQDWLVLSIPAAGSIELGITTGLQFLPLLLLSPYAGVVADMFPKRRLMQLTQATMALASLVLGLIAVFGAAQIWHVYLLAFAFGVGAAFDGPARQSFVSEMVDTDDVTNAVGLNAATMNTAKMLGPGLAGLLIAALGGDGPATGWVILINAVTYLAVIWQLQAMDTTMLHPSERQPRTPGMLREGLAYVRSQPRMVLALTLAFFAGTFGMNFQVTAALMATDVFGKGAREFGLLGTVMAMGALAGALLAARRVRIRLRLLVGAAIAFGIAEIVGGLAPTYAVFAAFSPVIGFCTLTLLNSVNATLQLESDPTLRGRVMALYMTIVMGGTALGAPVIGWVAEHFGARWSLFLGGILALIGAAVAVALYRSMIAPAKPAVSRPERARERIASGVGFD